MVQTFYVSGDISDLSGNGAAIGYVYSDDPTTFCFVSRLFTSRSLLSSPSTCPVAAVMPLRAATEDDFNAFNVAACQRPQRG